MADTAALFQSLKPLVDREVVQEVGAIYQFDVLDEVCRDCTTLRYSFPPSSLTTRCLCLERNGTLLDARLAERRGRGAGGTCI